MAVSSAEDRPKFPWGLQTCFQVYGTKRKFHHHSEPEMTNTDQVMMSGPQIRQESHNGFLHLRIFVTFRYQNQFLSLNHNTVVSMTFDSCISCKFG